MAVMGFPALENCPRFYRMDNPLVMPRAPMSGIPDIGK